MGERTDNEKRIVLVTDLCDDLDSDFEELVWEYHRLSCSQQGLHKAMLLTFRMFFAGPFGLQST